MNDIIWHFAGWEEMGALLRRFQLFAFLSTAWKKEEDGRLGMKLRGPSTLATLRGRSSGGRKASDSLLNQHCILIGCLCLPQFIPLTDWLGPSTHVRSQFNHASPSTCRSVTWDWLGSERPAGLPLTTIRFFLIKQMNHNPN